MEGAGMARVDPATNPRQPGGTQANQLGVEQVGMNNCRPVHQQKEKSSKESQWEVPLRAIPDTNYPDPFVEQE